MFSVNVHAGHFVVKYESNKNKEKKKQKENQRNKKRAADFFFKKNVIQM
jgi:hypothetical protein